VTLDVCSYAGTVATVYSMAAAIPGLTKTNSMMAECPAILINAAAKQFTLDYGSGCTGKDGKTHSGSIMVQYSGKLTTSGTTLAVTLNNYNKDARTLNGVVNVTVTSSTTITLA
jgi:hypothetical protein